MKLDKLFICLLLILIDSQLIFTSIKLNDISHELRQIHSDQVLRELRNEI